MYAHTWTLLLTCLTAVGPDDGVIALNHSSLRAFCFLSTGYTATQERWNWAVSVQLLARNHVVLRAPWCPGLAVT